MIAFLAAPVGGCSSPREYRPRSTGEDGSRDQIDESSERGTFNVAGSDGEAHGGSGAERPGSGGAGGGAAFDAGSDGPSSDGSGGTLGSAGAQFGNGAGGAAGSGAADGLGGQGNGGAVSGGRAGSGGSGGVGFGGGGAGNPGTGGLVKRQTGSPCTGANECESTACVNGLCCDRQCTGPCQACNVEGRVGICSARPSGTSCGSLQVCAAGVKTAAATCNADGVCPSPSLVTCANGCDSAGADCQPAAFGSRCQSNADCSLLGSTFFCLKDFDVLAIPNGLCTRSCSVQDATDCVSIAGACLSERTGLGHTPLTACFPTCKADVPCRTGLRCNFVYRNNMLVEPSVCVPE